MASKLELLQDISAEDFAYMNLRFFSEFVWSDIAGQVENGEFQNEWYRILGVVKRPSRLHIQAAREHAKTTCLSVKYPLWRVGRNPDLRVMIVSKSATLATTIIREIRQNIEGNSRLQAVFPSMKADVPWSGDELQVKRSPEVILKDATFVGVGLHGALTGKRADLIIVDDPFDESEVRTEAQRKKVEDWIEKVLIPTLTPDGEMVFVGTPWHYDDYWSHLETKGKDKGGMYVVKKYPAIKNPEMPVEEWEVQWPEVWSAERLAERKKEIGSIKFNCLTGDNLVVTNKGFKQVRDINLTDMMLTHKNNWHPIEYIHNEISDESIYDVRVWGEAKPLSLTGSHKVWAFKSRKYKQRRLAPWNWGISDFVNDVIDNSLGWYRTDELDQGDFLIYPINHKTCQPKVNDEDYWWMIGLYLAEGCLNYSNRRIHFTLGKKEKKLAEKLVKILKKFSIKPSVRPKEAVTQIDCSNKELFNVLKEFGRYAHGKKLTEEALFLPLNLQDALWSGYADGDGCSAGEDRISVGSTSLEMLVGFKWILLRLGIVGFIANCSKGGKSTILGRTVNTHPSYRILINRGGKLNRPAKIFNDCLFSRIRTIIPREDKEEVFNLQVKEDHSYTTSQGSVANCLYLLDPSGFEGALFKSEWLTYFDPRIFDEAYVRDFEYYLGVDPNVSDNPDSARMALVTIAFDRHRGDIFILDVYAEPKDFPSQMKKILEYGRRRTMPFIPGERRIRKVGIESNTWQQVVSKAAYVELLPVVEIKQKQTKVERLLGLQPHFENGRIKLPDPNKINTNWMDKFMDEYLSFPHGKYKDILDGLEIAFELVSVKKKSSVAFGPGD